MTVHTHTSELIAEITRILFHVLLLLEVQEFQEAIRRSRLPYILWLPATKKMFLSLFREEAKWAAGKYSENFCPFPSL